MKSILKQANNLGKQSSSSKDSFSSEQSISIKVAEEKAYKQLYEGLFKLIRKVKKVSGRDELYVQRCDGLTWIPYLFAPAACKLIMFDGPFEVPINCCT